MCVRNTVVGTNRLVMFKKYAFAAVITACSFLSHSQNVGIGVANPGSALSVKGGISIGDTYAEKRAPAGSILIEQSMGIGTDTIDPNVVLDIRSATKGVLFPTMSSSTIQSLTNPPKGLMVFNSDSAGFNFYNGTSWINFALLGPDGPIGAAASLLGGLTGTGSGAAYGASATTLLPVSIGTGTKIFTVPIGMSYRANDRVRISNTSSKYMEGTVTAYVAGVLTVNVDRTVGSGSYTSWSIGIAGDVGATGATGAQGAQGIQGPAGAQGIKGTTGATGATGAQGIQGVAGPQGAQGLKGATGADGADGAQGPQGIQGVAGPAGAQGLKGATGAAGSNGTVWYTGSGVPANGTGVQNDLYINTSNGTYYKKGASTWASQGNLKGATGATGAQGAQGVAGAQGIQGLKGNTGATGATGSTGAAGATGASTQWFSGNGNVGNGQGNVGDWYLRTSNGDVFEKTASNTWTQRMNIMGPAGSGGSGWGLAGNAASNGNFIGTTNSQPLLLKVNNTTSGYIASSDNNTFLGYNPNYGGSGSGNVGIGATSKVYGNTYSIAIGYGAGVQTSSSTAGNIAIGYSADVSGTSANSIAIGASSQTQGANAIAIGRGSNINQPYAMAFGDGAQAQGNSGIVIGKSAYTNSADAVAIGTSAQVQSVSGIGIGKSVYVSGSKAIAIGESAQAQGANSIVIGTGIYNGNANNVMIGNSSVTSVNFSGATTTSQAFMVGTNSTNGNGAYLTKGGTWTNASDRNLKEDIKELNSNDILNKVAGLDITKWKYKGTDEYHIGPMAQDFYAAFNVGTDDKRISSIDPSGVALVAIQALNQKVDEQQKVIEGLTKQLIELKSK